MNIFFIHEDVEYSKIKQDYTVRPLGGFGSCEQEVYHIHCTLKEFERYHTYDGICNSITHTDKDLLYDNVEDIIVKDNIQSDKFLRMILKHFNKDKKFLSHIFVFKPKDIAFPTFCVSDCVLNQYPDLNTRVKITDNAIEFFQKYMSIDDSTYYCNVNFLSHSGHFNIKNKTACEALLLKEHYKDTPRVVATDFQLDAALDWYVQKMKNPDLAPLCADVIIANDINEGNSIMKSFLLNRQYEIYGYVLGADTHIILNSRSNLIDNTGAINFLLDF